MNKELPIAISCSDFKAYLSNHVSFAEGLALFFKHKATDKVLYQVLKDEVRKIYRGYDNEFRQSSAVREGDSIVFKNEYAFKNFSPETIHDGFYLNVDFRFDKSVSVGEALDEMLSGKFVGMEDPATGITHVCKLVKDFHSQEYFWKSNDDKESLVRDGSFSFADLLEYKYYKFCLIKNNEEGNQDSIFPAGPSRKNLI